MTTKTTSPSSEEEGLPTKEQQEEEIQKDPFQERPLTEEEKKEWREKASQTLKELEQGIGTKSTSAPSWVRGSADSDSDDWLLNRSTKCRYFDTHGFLVLKSFASTQEVASLKQQMLDLVDNDWDLSSSFDSFGTDSKSNMKRGDYFLDSSNKVHYFAEPTALTEQEEEDKTQKKKQVLKLEYQTNRIAALNKVGHGMHTIPGAFQDYTLSEKMKRLVLELGWKDPVVPQSMYIFKQPKIGGSVTSHQDSTFLFTTPKQTCLGLWLALDDATLDNGCLWVRPGSHFEPLRRQFIRNPAYFNKNEDKAKENGQEEEEPPKLIFHNHYDDPNVIWEGGVPTKLESTNFIPVEVKAGDLVVFCGTLDHLSLPNFSNLQRHTFQLHLVEGPKEGVTWSSSNWLQYPASIPFVKLVEG